MGSPRELLVFVATRREDVSAGATRYLSVDGSVPGAAVVWDHHVSGEPINLDAMPPQVDLSGLDAVGTTLADTDAVVSAAVALVGGAATLRPEVVAVLRSASWWCDHLRGAPDVDAATNEAGRGLQAYVSASLAVGKDAMSQAFAEAVGELAGQLARDTPLPRAEPRDGAGGAAPRLRALGRLTEHGDIALVDLRGLDPKPGPLDTYAQHACQIAVTLDAHDDGGLRYTIGVNPHVENRPSDLRPALEALARAEHAHGPPALGPEPVPGNETWGGRATVFGSPWNYGSRLTPLEVVQRTAQALGLRAG
jgi:hypothetical protein